VTTTVRIPSDVDREDRLIAGLTARQLAYLAVLVVLLSGLWHLTSGFVPPPAFVFVATPLAAVMAVLGLARRDGLPADRLALAALRHVRSNPRLVPAPDGLPSLPPWARHSTDPAPLPSPVAGIDVTGVVDLGGEGGALVCRASSLNFGLRTADEQTALVRTFGQWLNSLSGPVQIVVRAERVDVADAVAALYDAAPSLPHPALERAAHEHAEYLSALAARRDVLRRVVLVVFRETAVGDGSSLARRADEATRALAGAGIALTPLSAEEVLDVFGRAAETECARPSADGIVRAGL
jgi:hypothetical protein